MRLALVAALMLAATGLITGAARPVGSSHLANGRLVYSLFDLEDVDGYSDLYVSDPNGARRHRILSPVEGSGTFFEARWSPDGSRIALTYTVGNRYTGYSSEVDLVNPDGSGLHPLVNDRTVDRTSPTWSPDGSQLAYVQWSRGHGTSEIWISDLSGSNRRLLTSGFDPAWSPDGSQIAFARIESGYDSDLWVIAPDGTGLRRVTQGPEADAVPGWSPDGQLLVFQREPRLGEAASIWLVRPDGTGRQKLTRGAYDTSPSWSPDGRRIIFSRNNDLWLMSRDGRGLRNLTRTRGLSHDEDGADWQPVRVVDGNIAGTRFDDYLVGDSGPNTIDGGAGNDLIAGGSGHDVLRGGPGKDVIYAKDGVTDIVDGGPGRDRAFVDRRDRVTRVERVVRR